jgi:hypothetical protein
MVASHMNVVEKEHPPDENSLLAPLLFLVSTGVRTYIYSILMYGIALI